VQTLRESVLTALRERILRRELRPGDRLVERELAAELGVSRTPVRECLLVLQMEGLADTAPGLGVVVRDIASGEVREALAVRGALDALAAREACEQRREEDLVLLEAALRLHELALRELDLDHIAHADREFHARIYAAAHNGTLAGVRSRFALYETFYFHGDVYRFTPPALARSLSRHRQILSAIGARDAQAAERATSLHIQEAVALVRDTREGSTEQSATTSRTARSYAGAGR
jgi:DNA-binding GntR family transcriptional regulator